MQEREFVGVLAEAGFGLVVGLAAVELFRAHEAVGLDSTVRHLREAAGLCAVAAAEARGQNLREREMWRQEAEPQSAQRSTEGEEGKKASNRFWKDRQEIDDGLMGLYLEQSAEVHAQSEAARRELAEARELAGALSEAPGKAEARLQRVVRKGVVGRKPVKRAATGAAKQAVEKAAEKRTRDNAGDKNPARRTLVCAACHTQKGVTAFPRGAAEAKQPVCRACGIAGEKAAEEKPRARTLAELG